MNTRRNFQNGASRGVGRWSLATRKDHSTSGGSLPSMTRPPFPFPLVVGDRMMNGVNQPLPPQLSPSPHATIPGVNSSREIGYGHYTRWPPETSLNTPPSVLASVSVPTLPTTTAQFSTGAGTEIVNHVSSQLPKGFDLNSMGRNCCEHTLSNSAPFQPGSSYAHPEGSSSASSLRPTTGSGWDPSSSPAHQKTGLWLIDKYLQSVDQNSSSPTQTTTGRPTMSRDDARPLVVRSPRSSSESTNEKRSGKEGSGHDRRLRPDLPSGGDVLLRAQTTSTGDGEPSPKKARAGEGRSKVESPVDAVTLAAWTEYFKRLYLYNSRKQEERETRTHTDAVDSTKSNTAIVDSATVPVAAPKPYRPSRAPSHKGRAGSKGSGGTTCVVPVTSVPCTESSSSSSSNGGLRPRLGCTVCGIIDVNWTIADFEKHVNCEEHRARYNNRYYKSSNAREYCKVCGQVIGDIPSRHSLTEQHLKILAMLQKGCPTCKVECFEVYKDYTNHINGIEHKNLQNRQKLDNSGEGSHSAEGGSVNISDKNRNQEKSRSSDQTISDSSQNFDITAAGEDRRSLVKQVKAPVATDNCLFPFSPGGPQPCTMNALKRRAENPTDVNLDISQKRMYLVSSGSRPDGESQLETTNENLQLHEPKNLPRNPLEKDNEDCCSDDIFVSVPGVYCKACKTIFDAAKCTRKQHSQLDSHRQNIQKLQRNSMSSESSPGKQKAISECNLNENTVVNNQKTMPQPSVEMGMVTKRPLEKQEHRRPDEELRGSLRKNNTDKKKTSDENVVAGTTEQTFISIAESSSCVAEDKTASNKSIEIPSAHLESSQITQKPLTDGRMVDDEVRTNSESDIICPNLQSGNFKVQSEQHDVSLEVQHSDTEISDRIQIPVFDVPVQATTQNEQHSTIGDISSSITPQRQPSQDDNLPDDMDEYSYSASVDSANMRSHTKTLANDYNVVGNGSTNKEMPETQETNSRVVNINCQDNKDETTVSLDTVGDIETSDFEPTNDCGIPETNNETMKTAVDTKLEEEGNNMLPEKPTTSDNCSNRSPIVNRLDETTLVGGSDEKVVQIPEEVGNGCKVS